MKQNSNFMFVFALVLNLWSINANALEHICNRWNVLLDNGFVLGPIYGDIWTDGYKLQGDTTINNMHYSCLQFADGHKSQQSESGDWVYHGAIRETANAEVYFVPSGQSKEYLLFAFNAQVGDKIENLYVMNEDYNTWAIVKNITEEEIILDLYEQFDENENIFMHDYVWVKGVGAKRSMFQPLPNGEVGGNVVNFLLCAYNNEKHIYISDAGEKYGCEYSANATTQQLLGEWQVYRERVTGTMWDNEGMPYTGSYTHDVNMRMLYVFTPDFEYELQMDEASGVVHYSDTRSYTIEPLTTDTWLLTINGAFDTPKPSDPAISGRSPITIYKITENEMEWEYTYYSGDEGSMTYYQYVRRYQSDEQGVENVLSTSSARKILRNNQILILRGDHTYTLTGQEVK